MGQQCALILYYLHPALAQDQEMFSKNQSLSAFAHILMNQSK